MPDEIVEHVAWIGKTAKELGGQRTPVPARGGCQFEAYSSLLRRECSIRDCMRGQIKGEEERAFFLIKTKHPMLSTERRGSRD